MAALLLLLPGRAPAQMAAEGWSASAGHAGAKAPSGPPFPAATYGAAGAALAYSGHFTEQTWTSDQIEAFVGGFRAAFAGQAQPTDAQGSVGFSVAQSAHLPEMEWSAAQVNAFLDGLGGAFSHPPSPPDASTQRLLAAIARRIADLEALRRVRTPASAGLDDRVAAYLRHVRERLGLQQSASGLAYRVEAGRGGARPRPGDTIVFTCQAVSADGATPLPQLSGTRVRAPMTGLLPGLMEGLQMMTIDSSAVFVLPPALSFGHGDWPQGVPPGTPLIFRVTLLDVAAAR